MRFFQAALTAPAAVRAHIDADSLKKPNHIVTRQFSEVVKDHANCNHLTKQLKQESKLTTRVMAILSIWNWVVQSFENGIQKLCWSEFTEKFSCCHRVLFFWQFKKALFTNRIHKTYFLISLLWEYFSIHDSIWLLLLLLPTYLPWFLFCLKHTDPHPTNTLSLNNNNYCMVFPNFVLWKVSIMCKIKCHICCYMALWCYN